MCAREVERNRKRVKGKGKDKGKMLEREHIAGDKIAT